MKSAKRAAPDNGRTVVITGTTSGVGTALAATLGRNGWRVLAGGRSEASASAAVHALRTAVPGGSFEPIWADLARPAQVRHMARQVLDRCDTLDALVNNAALTRFEPGATPEGLELHFAVNCLGPFVLTQALAPALAAAGNARVVNVASELYERIATLEPETIPEPRAVAPMTIYAQTKVGLVWLTRAFADRFAAHGITVNAAHPGFVASSMTRDARGPWRWLFAATRPFQKSPDAGAQTPLFLVDSRDAAGHSGAFFSRCAVRQLTPLGADDVRAERFFTLCETIAGA